MSRFATISYEESNNKFFHPVDEIIEALDNNEGVLGMSNAQLKSLVASNAELHYYVTNFNTAVFFEKNK